MASALSSPVLILTNTLTGVTQIFPSPILPVCAEFEMASTTRVESVSSTTISTFTLGTKSTRYSAPR